jgi:hypothetical protein
MMAHVHLWPLFRLMPSDAEAGMASTVAAPCHAVSKRCSALQLRHCEAYAIAALAQGRHQAQNNAVWAGEGINMLTTVGLL